MTCWRRVLIGLLTLSVGVGGWVSPSPATTGRHLLDGRVFVVETGLSGEGPSGRDVYLFREGKFLFTSHTAQHGFRPGPYTELREGNVIHFTVDGQSPTRGSIHWEGTVRGEHLNASFSWRDAPKRYSWHNRPVNTGPDRLEGGRKRHQAL